MAGSGPAMTGGPAFRLHFQVTPTLFVMPGLDPGVTTGGDAAMAPPASGLHLQVPGPVALARI
jgi:hypothetical protein